MKIVYEIERLSTSGGIERILTDRLNYMTEYWGWDITVITLLEKNCEQFYKLSPKVNVIGLGIKSKGLIMCIEALWTLNKVIKKINPDIYVTFQTIGALSCLFKTHKTYTIYESHLTRMYMPHSIAISIAERFADKIVVLTQGQKKEFPKAKSIQVIPNFSLISPITLPDYNSKIIVAAGRKCHQKNFERLHSLWNKVQRRKSDWQLKIHHNTKNMASAYAEGSIFVFTSRFEGFGLVLIEAMQCGLPCIAFDCPYGPREIIEDGKTGFLIPYNDDALFIEKLTFLMENPKEREQMGRAALESAKRFDKEKIMNQWKELLTKL